MEFQEQKKLIEYLPEFLQGFREYRLIFDAEQKEMDRAQMRISNLLSDLFTDTATEEGIARREKMYGIMPREDASLEERRAAVKTKEVKSLPYTVRQYREMLVAMAGSEDNFRITLDPKACVLDVKIRAGQKEERDAAALLYAVDELTRQIKPANLIYQSALFEYHNISLAAYSGAAACVRKKYIVEVI